MPGTNLSSIFRNKLDKSVEAMNKEELEKLLASIQERAAEKERQRQALIELMRLDEELGLYDSYQSGQV